MGLLIRFTVLQDPQDIGAFCERLNIPAVNLSQWEQYLTRGLWNYLKYASACDNKTLALKY